MRKYRRKIAKARLRALGIAKPNRKMRQDISNNKNRRWQRTRKGRKLLDKIREDKPALWRQVLTGTLVENAKKAQAKTGKKKVASEQRAAERRRDGV